MIASSVAGSFPRGNSLSPGDELPSDDTGGPDVGAAIQRVPRACSGPM